MPSRRAMAAVVVLALLLAGVGLSLLNTGAGAAEGAEQRAYAAEEAYLEAQLSNADCLTDYGLDVAPVVSPKSSVVGGGVDGLLVEVTVPYYVVEETEDGELVGDTYSEATYRVSRSDTTRVSGDEVTPC